MSQERMDEVIEIVLTDKDSRKKLKELGISDKEVERYIQSILKKPDRSYHRILAEDEKRVITPQAFGYLMHLLLIQSINSISFEKVIAVCMQLHVFLKRRVDKEMIDEIVNYIIFSGEKEISLRDLMDIFYLENEDMGFDEEIN